jgi:hypothetical protein
MTDLTLDARNVATLTRYACVLIPGTARMPAATEIEDFGNLLQSAVKACGYALADVQAALEGMSSVTDLESAKVFAAADPARFEIASTIVSGAYFMSPVVLDRLGYPTERRHPAGPEEFLDEYETGILEPVMARGARFRDPR